VTGKCSGTSRHCQKYLLSFALLFIFQPIYAQEKIAEPFTPKTNLELIQDAIQNIIGEIVDSVHLLPGDSVTVAVMQQQDRWIIEQSITSKFQFLQMHVFTENKNVSDSQYRLDVNPILMQVRYIRMFKDGMFGTKSVEREVSVQLSHQLKRQRSGEVLLSRTHSRTFVDTIAVDQIDRVEQEGLNVTHAELPPDNFIDKIIEPFVIIGATGVAIYLLFHIRS